MHGSAEEMRQRLAEDDDHSHTVSDSNNSSKKYDGMKVLMLRKELKKRGLSMSGAVDELKQRLVEDDAGSEKILNPQQVFCCVCFFSLTSSASEI